MLLGKSGEKGKGPEGKGAVQTDFWREVVGGSKTLSEWNVWVPLLFSKLFGFFKMVSKHLGRFQNCPDISRRLQNLPGCFKTVQIFPDSLKNFWTASKLSGSFHMISKSSSRSQNWLDTSRLFQIIQTVSKLSDYLQITYKRSLPDGLKTDVKTVRTFPDDFKTFFTVSE